MVYKPNVILFDEPTSALDPELVSEVLNVMKELEKNGATMVAVTHEMQFAQDIVTKAVFTDGSVVVESGTPQKVFDQPNKERTIQFLRTIAYILCFLFSAVPITLPSFAFYIGALRIRP